MRTGVWKQSIAALGVVFWCLTVAPAESRSATVESRVNPRVSAPAGYGILARINRTLEQMVAALGLRRRAAMTSGITAPVFNLTGEAGSNFGEAGSN